MLYITSDQTRFKILQLNELSHQVGSTNPRCEAVLVNSADSEATNVHEISTFVQSALHRAHRRVFTTERGMKNSTVDPL